ncbi:hypothetical protein Lepto7375DRAFT_1689 [Leptolyngbya sp. PCC 7375]|nr:hypothetical protein Lepto7375DRAFT_1689 [Leptolyngbya sp. PCC 7375]
MEYLYIVVDRLNRFIDVACVALRRASLKACVALIGAPVVPGKTP